MKKFAVFAFAAAAGVMAWADWPSTGGGPARDGWAKSETALSPQTAKDIKLIYVHKFENAAKGENALGTPLVLSRIVTWKGFKALLYVGSANETVYAIDSELGREFSRSPLGAKEKVAASASTPACPGGLTANITLPGSINAGGRGRGGGGGARGASGAARGGGGGGGRRVRPRGPQPSVYAIG